MDAWEIGAVIALIILALSGLHTLFKRK